MARHLGNIPSDNRVDMGQARGNKAPAGGTAPIDNAAGASWSQGATTTHTAATEHLDNHAVSMLSSRAGATQRRARQQQKQGGRARRIFSNLLLAVGIILLLVAGGMFAVQRWGYFKQDQLNKKLASHVQIVDSPSQGSEGEKVPVTVDWEGLKKVNDEVVGWLYVPGTSINHPIYQHSDNEYYLHTTAEGEWSVGGQLFMDFENVKPGLKDNQTLIYGHHLLNGTMFEEIANLDDQKKFDQMGTIWYITEEGAHRLKPLFFYDTAREDMDARTINFATPDEFHTFLAQRLEKAQTRRKDADMLASKVDHVMTMSTCVYYDKYEKDQGRGLLVCAPVEEIEAAGAQA